MSELTTAARPYAKAVYDTASETGTLESWSDALVNLSLLVADSQIKQRLESPDLSAEQKGELLIEVLGKNLSEQQQNLVRLMAKNGRLKLMANVAQQFEAARRQSGKQAGCASNFSLCPVG